MQRREKLNVRVVSLVWNATVAIFSWLGIVKFVIPVFLPILLEQGVNAEFCGVESEQQTPWVFFFILSKLPELFDTCLHIMNKQPLRFMHCYHHLSVMWFCWFAWYDRSSSWISLLTCIRAHQLENGSAFAAMNLIGHAVTYSYYTINAWGIKVPQQIRMSITTLQISQMVCRTSLFTIVSSEDRYLASQLYPIRWYIATATQTFSLQHFLCTWATLSYSSTSSWRATVNQNQLRNEKLNH